MKMLDASHTSVNKIDVGINENCTKNSEKCDDISDDIEGGWGYAVCLGLSVVFVIGIGPMSSIGLLYEDFLESIGEVTRALTITFGIGNAMVAFAGMVTTCALKKYSLRQVGLFGTAVFTVASFLAIFVNSLATFIFVNGVIQPIGFGIMMPISLTSFNTYFHKRRSSMMSIVSVMVGAGGMVFPTLVEKMMEAYGFRGTLALLCAINLHVIPGVAVMQPVKWHQKQKKTKAEKEEEPIIETKKYIRILNVKSLDENCNDDNVATANEPLLVNLVDTKILMEQKIDESILHHRKVSLVDKDDVTLSKCASIASLGNRAGNAMITEVLSSGGKWKGLIEFLDLNLLKDFVYCNICFGITLSVFADITFFTLEPAILTSFGYNKTQIAYCITVGAFADLISRIIFALASFRVKLKSRAVFFIGNTFMIIFRIAFIQSTNLNYLMVMTGCLGFFRHWILMNAPLVFADHCSVERFPAAYGLNMLISGISNLMLGPMTGIIKEMWHDFIFVMYYLIICSVLCFVPWTIEFIIARRLKKRRQSNQ